MEVVGDGGFLQFIMFIATGDDILSFFPSKDQNLGYRLRCILNKLGIDLRKSSSI